MKEKSKWKWIALTVFLLILITYYFVWALIKGYDFGPDEYHRYPMVYYVYKYLRLPSGYEVSIRNEVWGFSYAFLYTWFPTLASVLCMRFVSIFDQSHEALLYAARFPGAIAGVLAVLFIFLTLDVLLKNEKTKWVITIMIAFIPQFAFLTSYVNNDIYAVMGASIICFGWTQGYKKGWNIKNCIALAIGISVVVLSYYNAYGWVLLSLVVFLFALLFAEKQERKKLYKLGLLVTAICVLICGFFLVRNLVIYHGDLLGMNSLSDSSEMYAIKELKPSNRNTLASNGKPIWALFDNDDWYTRSIKSFFGCFWYMGYYLTDKQYTFYYIAYGGMLALSLVDTVYVVVVEKGKEKIKSLLYRFILLVAGLIPIFLSMYYSWGKDYSPQGRYFYPLLPALAVFMALGLDRIVTFAGKKKAIGIAMSVVLIAAALVIIWANWHIFQNIYVPAEGGYRGEDFYSRLSGI